MVLKWNRKKPEINKAIKDLDKILDKCKWRVSNHYRSDDWEILGFELTGSYGNPVFEDHIYYLKEEGLIRDAVSENGIGYYGCVATTKGQMFKGFEKSIIDAHEQKRSKNNRTIWVSLASGILGTAIGLSWSIYQDWQQEKKQEALLNSLKSLIRNDTVYIKNQVESSDTSLIRIVKQKK